MIRSAPRRIPSAGAALPNGKLSQLNKMERAAASTTAPIGLTRRYALPSLWHRGTIPRLRSYQTVDGIKTPLSSLALTTIKEEKGYEQKATSQP